MFLPAEGLYGTVHVSSCPTEMCCNSGGGTVSCGAGISRHAAISRLGVVTHSALPHGTVQLLFGYWAEASSHSLPKLPRALAELQDANRVPIVTVRVVLKAIPHVTACAGPLTDAV